MNELALFAGAGGGILGGKLLGWRTVCAVEFDPYARDVLLARQNDGCFEPFPVWDDVRTFDGRPWRGAVDVVSGGFPCQDISAAGKGAGIGGERSGLWREMARIVGEVQPRFVWVENSPMLVGRGLGLVLLDLAALGFSARWGVVGACDSGAPHQRDRIWIVAHAKGYGHGIRREAGDIFGEDGKQNGQVRAVTSGASEQPENVAYSKSVRSQRHIQSRASGESFRERIQPQPSGVGSVSSEVADTDSAQREGNQRAERIGEKHANPGSADWWLTEPDVGRVAHGVAARVDRLRCTGNGQVPAVAALAWRILAGGLELSQPHLPGLEPHKAVQGTML